MKIKYILNGIEHDVQAEEGRTLLDTAMMAQLNPPYSCMEGSCGSCEALIEQGITSENSEPGRSVRTCQALPWSEYTVVNYDKGLIK